MASGLSSALSWSDSNGLSRETLHKSSTTPEEAQRKDSLSQVSPVGDAWLDVYTRMMMELKQTLVQLASQETSRADFSRCGVASAAVLQPVSFRCGENTPKQKISSAKTG